MDLRYTCQSFTPGGHHKVLSKTSRIDLQASTGSSL